MKRKNKPTANVETLLLVDDNPDNLLVMKKVLQKALPQVEIVTFQKPEEVMDYVRTANVSVAILDVQMPGISGIELCRMIKAAEETRHIPVILVTSHKASSGLKAKGLDVGADDFLTRPIDNKELVARVKVALRTHLAEDELRHTAEQVQQDYQLLFEKMLSGFAVHEMIFDGKGNPVDYRFLSVNPAFETLLNLRAEEVLGKTIGEVIPGLEPQWLERYGRVVETGESVHFEDYSAPLDRCFDVSAFRTGENQFATSFTDITERKQAEEKLAKAKAKQAKMVANIGDVIVIIDQDGINRYKSPNISKWFGWKPEELVGLSTLDNVHPDDVAKARELIGDLMSKPNRTGIIECRYRCKDGMYKWIELTGINLLHDLDIQGIMGNYHDITERKQVAEALRVSEERFRNVAESMSDWVWEMNADGFYTYSSGNLKTTLGYQEAEILGKTPFDFMPADEANRVGVLFGEILRDKKGFRDLENWNITKDGRRICLRTSGTPLFGDAGEFLGYRGVDTDITERKRTAEKLKQQQHLLERAQELGQIGSWELDLGRNHLYWTDENCRIFGVPAGSVVDYETFLAKIHPDDLEYVDREWKAALDGKPYDIEHRIVVDDITKWVREKAEVNFDGEGVAIKAVGFTQDITERKRVELYQLMSTEVLAQLYEPTDFNESLSEILKVMKKTIGCDALGIRLESGEDYPYYLQDGFSEEFLLQENSVIEHDSAGGVCRNPDGTVCLECTCGLVISGKIDPDNSYCTRGGSFWTNDSFPLLDLSEKQDPRNKPRNQCIHQNYASVAIIPIHAKDRIVGILQINDKKNGLFTLSTIQQLEGIASHLGSALMQKRAEEEKRRLLAAIEQSAEGVAITDIGGLVQYVNPAFEGITGYSLKEVLGDNLRFLKSGEHEASWDTLLKGETWHEQFTNRRKNGDMYVEDVVISPIHDAEGVITNFVAVKRDITEQQELEEHLRESQKMEAVGQLAAGVAHDFNNQLQVILGYCDLLLASAPNEEIGDMVRPIQASAEAAQSTTSHLLSFSRRQVLSPSQVDLKEFLESLQNPLQKMIKEEFTLDINAEAGLPSVFVDRALLHQALMNLVLNARDAMPEGGAITVRSKIHKERLVDPKGPFVQIEVIDSGEGMPPELRKRIFEPFFTTKPEGKGTGLGLSMVLGFMEQIEGVIEVDSIPGQGTTIRLLLPLMDITSSEQDQDASPAPIQPGTTILIVEDEAHVRAFLQTMLKRSNYDVHVASLPSEAVEMVVNQGLVPDLMLSDVVMPEMRGTALAQIIKESLPDLPILFMTGYSDIDLQGLEVIRKPVGNKELLLKIEELLR
jgi:PAS domain S-box-containing protein